jgi:deoxyribose-phosphate aldolase
MTVENINRYLDHAVLKPELTPESAREAIQLGIDHQVRTVCVRPADIPMAAEMCKGTNTEVSCVLSFPHGCTLSSVKAEEAAAYIAAGTNEIDMVANIGLIRAGDWDAVTADIAAVTSVAARKQILVKVILETSYLTLDEIKRATECVIAGKAQFAKTSTGFAEHGATEDAVRAMLDVAGGRIEVKPSGGIRNREAAEFYIGLGATRIGNGYSSTPAICDGAAESSDKY